MGDKRSERVAELSGISYAESTFFVDGVARNQVPGAVASVANASKEALDRAALEAKDGSGD